MRPFLILTLVLDALPACADDQPAAGSLVKSLSSQDSREAAEAGAALVKLGQPALSELQRAANSNDPELSERAAHVLNRFWTPEDLVPADAVEALREIRSEHDRRSAAGDEQGAAEIAKAWTDLRGQIAEFDVRTAQADKPEVHAVGFDRGRVDGTRGDRAEVEISRTGAPVVLVLTGQSRVRWDVRVADGAELKMVIVTGPVSQVVRGVPDSVPVLRRIGTEGAPFAHATSFGDDGWDDFARQAAEWTGGEVLSLQGGTEYAGTPVQIGEADPAWRFRRVLARVRRLHHGATSSAQAARQRAAASLRFLAAVHTLDQGDGLGPADFTPVQVLRGTLNRTPRPINHVTVDRELGVHYAASSVGVFRIDRAGQMMEALVPGDRDDVPDFNQPCGIAFDARRRRLAVITSGGSGVFYVYDTVEKSWSSTADLGGRNLSGLAYAGREDTFYALDIPQESRETSTLLKLSAEGSVTGAVKLSRPFPCRAGRPEQVVCVETPDAPDGARFRIVLLGAPVKGSGGTLVRHCFVVEPESGRVEFSAGQDASVTGD